VTSPRNVRPQPEAEHDRLAHLLTSTDRTWLARMADVLPWGWVIPGMATPRRGGVVGDSGYPGGIRLVVPPAGPAGQARAR
jgi:hypothetical protein